MFDLSRVMRRSVFLSACLMLPSLAWAGRPFSTEDAGVIRKGQCEVEAFVQRHDFPGNVDEQGVSGRLACGVIGATQLGLQALRSEVSGDKTRVLVLSGKTQLVDGGANQSSFALAYSTARERILNESWRSGDTAVNLVATVPEQQWLVHFNLGVTAQRRPNRNVTTWALAFERLAWRPNVDAGLEFIGDDRDTFWIQTVARWHFLPERLIFDASLGRQFSGPDTNRLTAGLKWLF